MGTKANHLKIQRNMKRTQLFSLAFFFVSLSILPIPSCPKTRGPYYHPVGTTWGFSLREELIFHVHYEKCEPEGYTIVLENKCDKPIPYLYFLSFGGSSNYCNGTNFERFKYEGYSMCSGGEYT